MMLWETFAAKFQVQLRGFNYDDADMICADIFIDFMKGRPGSAAQSLAHRN